MKGEAFVPVLNPGIITISITLANLMQGVEQHDPQCQCMWRQRPQYGRSRLTPNGRQSGKSPTLKTVNIGRLPTTDSDAYPAVSR